MDDRAPVTLRVDYDALAATYDQRYEASTLQEVDASLLALVESTNATQILEVGCGTGHWLQALASPQRNVLGLDPSWGMLRRAQQRVAPFRLLEGQAEVLPFAAGMLDFLYVVNALHHFQDKTRFLSQARRTLKRDGTLAIVAFDPREHQDWFIYQYFEGTYELDLKRMPASSMVYKWLQEAGFTSIIQQSIPHTYPDRYGRAVFDDPFVQKHGTSELALLSDEAYEVGLQRIRDTVTEAERTGKMAVFRAHNAFTMTVGKVPA